MSKASAGIGAFMIVAVLALSMILIYQFGFTSAASTSLGVNLTGTTYQQAYNQSENTTRAAFFEFSYTSMFLGIAALIFAVMLIFAMVRK